MHAFKNFKNSFLSYALEIYTYIPCFKPAICTIFFVLNRDVENQLNEMRRPLLNQMVELWKTMGLTHLQEARIDPMLGYFKGKYLLMYFTSIMFYKQPVKRGLYKI